MANLNSSVDLKVIISVIQDSQSSIKKAVGDLRTLIDAFQQLDKSKLTGVGEQVKTLASSLPKSSEVSGWEKLGKVDAPIKPEQVEKIGVTAETAGHKVTPLIEKLRDLKKAWDAIGKNSEASELEKEIENSGRAMSKLNQFVEHFGRAIGFFTGGFLGYEAVRFVKEIVDVAARTEVLGTVLNVVGNNAGISSEKLNATDKAVQRLGITATASRQALTQMVQAGLNIDTATGQHGLARAAQDLAVIGGINSSEAFTRLITAIQQGNTEGLRTLGIVVSNEQAQVRYAQALKKTVGELTTQEKTQALENEVLRKAADLTGTYERAMSDVGKQLTSLPRYTEELSAAVGERLLPVYRVLIEQYTLLLTDLTSIAEEQNKLSGNTDGLASIVNRLANGLRILVEFLAKHSGAILVAIEVYAGFKIAVVALEAVFVNLPLRLKNIATGVTLFWEKLVVLKEALIGTKTAVVAMDEGLAAMQEAQVAVTASTAATESSLSSITTTLGGVATGAAGLAASWIALAAVLAAPIIAYVVIKKQEEDDLKKSPVEAASAYVKKLDEKPSTTSEGQSDYYRAKGNTDLTADKGLTDAFARFKAENKPLIDSLKDKPGFNPEATAPVAGEPIGEAFLKQVREYNDTIKNSGVVSELKQQEESVKSLTKSYEDLKKEANALPVGSPAQGAKLEEVRFENAKLTVAKDRVTSLQEQLSSTNTSAVLTDKLISARSAELQATQKLEQIQLLRETDKGANENQIKSYAGQEKDALEARDKAHKKTKEIEKSFDEAESKASKLPEEVAKDKADVEQKARAYQENQRQTDLIAAHSRQFSGTNVVTEAGELTTSKAGTTAVSDLRKDIEELRLRTSKEDVQAQVQNIQTELRTAVTSSIKEKGDQALFTKALGELQAELKVKTDAKLITPKDTAALTGQIKVSQGLAQLQVENTQRSTTAPLDQRAEAFAKVKSGQSEEELNNQLQLLKNIHAKEEAEDSAAYRVGKFNLETYFAAREQRIREAGALELELQKTRLENLKNEYKALGASAPPERRLQFQNQITQQQNVVSRLEGGQPISVGGKTVAAPSDVDVKLSSLGIEKSQQLERAKIELEQVQSVSEKYYSGLSGTLTEIDRKYDRMEMRLKDIKGSDEFLEKARQVELFKAVLEESDKQLKLQLDDSAAINDLQKAVSESTFKDQKISPTEYLADNNRYLEQRRKDIETQVKDGQEHISILRDQIISEEASIRQKAEADGLSEVDTNAKVVEGLKQIRSEILQTQTAAVKLNTEYIKLGDQIETYGDQLNKTFGDGLRNTISDSIMAMKKETDILVEFGRGLQKKVADIVAGDISAIAIKAISRPKIGPDGQPEYQKDANGEVITKNGKPVPVTETPLDKLGDFIGGIFGIEKPKDAKKPTGNVGDPVHVMVDNQAGKASSTGIGSDTSVAGVRSSDHLSDRDQPFETPKLGGSTYNWSQVPDVDEATGEPWWKPDMKASKGWMYPGGGHTLTPNVTHTIGPLENSAEIKPIFDPAAIQPITDTQKSTTEAVRMGDEKVTSTIDTAAQTISNAVTSIRVGGGASGPSALPSVPGLGGGFTGEAGLSSVLNSPVATPSILNPPEGTNNIPFSDSGIVGGVPGLTGKDTGEGNLVDAMKLDKVPDGISNAAKGGLDKVFENLQGGFGGIFKSFSGILGMFSGGGGGGGGVLGLLKMFGLATGGLVHGPGTGTSDDVPIMASHGEYVMTEKKTKEWYPVLEGIRKGSINSVHDLVQGATGLKKYALGGMIGDMHKGMAFPLPAFAGGGSVDSLQSIAINPVVSPKFSGGGDASHAQVPELGKKDTFQLSLHPDMLHMTMRDWFEREVARQESTR